MRVSNQQLYSNFERKNTTLNTKLNEQSVKIESQRRYFKLGEAPLAAAHSSYNQTIIQRYQQYLENTSFGISRYQLTESRIAQSIEVLQDIRELSVQAANSTNSAEDLQRLAQVVNELLEELLALANSRDEQGRSLFAGTAIFADAFEVNRTYSSIFAREIPTQVSYQGNAEKYKSEIEDGVYLSMNATGNQLFWSGVHEIMGALPLDNFRVIQDEQFSIDGVLIFLQAGDNMSSIVRKINDAPVAVEASLDPVTQTLTLRSNNAHQIDIQQPAESTILQEIGLLTAGSNSLSQGLAVDAREEGSYLFDVVIRLRNSLLNDDKEAVGSIHLAKLDESLTALNNQRTALGSRQQRLENQQSYNESLLVGYQELESSENDLDAASALSEMQRLMVLQQAVYQTISRLAGLNLMSFL